MSHNSGHNYGLDWIDQDALYGEVRTSFAKALGIVRPNKSLPIDPFTIVAQAMIANTTLASNLSFETQRKVNKTISNAVGGMHQRILSLAPNWESLGTSGGLLDIHTVPGYNHPKFNKPIVAEVKNRFNTVKASEEPALWDKIDQSARLMSAQGYLFQITPENPKRYDRMWAPSNRTPKSTVRVCDGATAYELVFGHKDALRELYFAIPAILKDIKDEEGISGGPMPDFDHMKELYLSVFPN